MNNLKLSKDNLRRFKNFIQESAWVFAKTYAKKAPHYYVVKDTLNHKEFEWVTAFIRENGVKRRFWNKEFIYFYIPNDGFKYWTYGDPIEKTEVINKAKYKP